MEKSILKSLFVASLGMFAMSSVQAEEKVVALVDSIPVLNSQVQAVAGKKGNTKAALEKIIDDILIQKAVQESGVSVTPEQVEQMIEVIAAQNGLTYGQFLDALDYQGITLEAFSQQLAEQMIMGGVREYAIGHSVQVTREEVDELGQKMWDDAKATGKEKKVSGKEYQVRHILLKLNPMLNDAQAKSQLAKVREDIAKGKITFAEAALKYSKDYLSGANGGSLGYAFPEVYAPQFAETIKRTKQGVISAPFKTEFGWHILEVMGTRDSDRTEQAYRQKAYEKIVNTQLKAAEKDWVKALRKNAHIEYLNK